MLFNYTQAMLGGLFMENTPLLFSLLFLVVCAVYLFSGIYIIYRNPREKLNKALFAVSVSLSLWSLGFALAIGAPDLETALLSRRLAALGWGSIYTLFLHFIILLTNFQPLLKNRLLLPLLYFPAVISIYAFALSNTITTTQYNLAKIDYGWINVAVQNTWTSFFQTYYIIYVLACLLILMYWKIKSSDERVKKQANLIFISLFIALILGSLTDVIWSSRLSTPLPQMAPVFILIPIATIHYLINRYGLMREVEKESHELLLSSETKIRLNYYLAIALISVGLFLFLVYFLSDIINRESLIATLYTGGSLIIMGWASQLLQIITNQKIKDCLGVAMMVFNIPLITLIFIEYAGITVWAFPFIIIIISLIFDSRIPLLLIIAITIVTQILVWMYAPAEAMEVGELDFILRIALIIVALFLGSFINATYINRLKENLFQIKFQKIISETSATFVSLNFNNFDEKINIMLNKIGHFFLGERVYLFTLNQADNTVIYSHEWCREDVTPKIGQNPIILDDFPLWREELYNNRLVLIEDVEQLADEAKGERKWMTQNNLKSLLLVPVLGNKNLLGFIGLEGIKSFENFTDNHLELLKILANLLADGLTKNQAEREIQYMAYYDQLTALPNHTLFLDRLSQAIYLAKRNERFIGVIFIDLDSFKTVNDTMGHGAGDTVIKKVAQILAGSLRKTDTVARFGGDEFLLLLNNIDDNNNIIMIAENIMKLFEDPLDVNGQEFFITCSAGIAVYPYDGEEAETLIKNADIAMYKAKSRGKNQFALCTVDMKEEVKRNMILSNNLYRALDGEELILFYQPQINLHTGKIIGLEALLRWQHPEMGMIAPGVFIPLAETNGLINSIGEWVLKTAIRQNKEWQDIGLPPLLMAVNLSIIQLNNSRIVESVEHLLKETGLDPKYLELEITEGAAMRETNHIIEVLNKFKELGVSIAIDDFGIEYSSLNRLKMLPIDRIKIDKQFVQGIEGSEKDQAITDIIINLGKSLGLKVLAEGVETASQLEFLNQKMCDDVQGYFFYKPMSAEDIEKILQTY